MIKRQATFVGVLAVLSVGDIAAGLVDGTRLASHLGVVAGLVLVAFAARAERVLPPPGAVTGAGSTRDSTPGSAPGTGVAARPRRRGAA